MKDRKRQSDGDCDDQSTSGNDEDYRRKRDRNNQAVKRSRVKSKIKTKETQERVDDLKKRNSLLTENIDKKHKELKFLKDLFLAQAKNKAQTLTQGELKELLQSDDEDDGCGGQSTSKT